MNSLQPIFDIFLYFNNLGESLWEWLAFQPVIQNNPGISLIAGVLLLGYLKMRGSNNEWESSDAFEEWIIDVLAGAWVSIAHDLPEILSSLLESTGMIILSGIRRISESENFSLFGGSLIDLSLVNWKTILFGVLGILGVSVGAVFRWFPF